MYFQTFLVFLNTLVPLDLSWLTVTNKKLPVFPALIGVQLSESATLTEMTGCWLSLSEHAQMLQRVQVQIRLVGFLVDVYA